MCACARACVCVVHLCHELATTGVECLPTVSLVSTAVRVPDQNTLGFGFNFSFTPSMTPCDPAIAKIYPDLVASIAGIVPALHLWDVVIENVTNCDM